jgi:hypothetical protein
MALTGEALSRRLLPFEAAPPVLSIEVVQEQQFWDQEFRRNIKQNEKLALRDLQAFDFSAFERVRSCIADGEASVDDLNLIGRLLACFVFKFNVRFAKCIDHLEAFTVFDPRPNIRQKNKAMVRPYLITLLRRFRLPAGRAREFDSSSIIQSAQSFFAMTSEEPGYNYQEALPIGRYFRGLYDSRVDLKAFAYYSVFNLRLFMTGVACESRFNIMKLRQDKGNSGLGDEKLHAAFIFQDCKRSIDTDFPLTYQEMEQWRKTPRPMSRGTLAPTQLKRRRETSAQTGSGIDTSTKALDLKRRRKMERDLKRLVLARRKNHVKEAQARVNRSARESKDQEHKEADHEEIQE